MRQRIQPYANWPRGSMRRALLPPEVPSILTPLRPYALPHKSLIEAVTFGGGLLMPLPQCIHPLSADAVTRRIAPGSIEGVLLELVRIMLSYPQIVPTRDHTFGTPGLVLPTRSAYGSFGIHHNTFYFQCF
jgi:hypothetical protein